MEVQITIAGEYRIRKRRRVMVAVKIAAGWRRETTDATRWKTKTPAENSDRPRAAKGGVHSTRFFRAGGRRVSPTAHHPIARALESVYGGAVPATICAPMSSSE
jgi:hypothetical protein